jgi:hypothetical protein
MSELRYRSSVDVEALAIDECTIHGAGNDGGARWWNLWLCVNRETDGVADYFVVPVLPNGAFTESGPGGKTWGLSRAEPGAWQVSPSINVLNTGAVHPGEHAAPSLWHQTPKIVGVPEGEAWIAGQP